MSKSPGGKKSDIFALGDGSAVNGSAPAQHTPRHNHTKSTIFADDFDSKVGAHEHTLMFARVQIRTGLACSPSSPRHVNTRNRLFGGDVGMRDASSERARLNDTWKSRVFDGECPMPRSPKKVASKHFGRHVSITCTRMCTERNPITGVTTYVIATSPSPLANGADGPSGEMAKYPNKFSAGVSC